jgi:DNA-binding response OmpR family regulator
MHRIMIVDDEQDLVHGLAMNFKREGYAVFEAYDGSTALKLAVQENPHLMLLDVMMPDITGLQVCQALRRMELNTRIIMLSAKTDEIDRVVGLEVGADDYVQKPFSLRELLALVHARLRYRELTDSELLTRYQLGNVEIDFEKLRATRERQADRSDGERVDILRCLICHRNHC